MKHYLSTKCKHFQLLSGQGR